MELIRLDVFCAVQVALAPDVLAAFAAVKNGGLLKSSPVELAPL